MRLLYKILPRADWLAAVGAGIYRGSPLDLKDGFIHLSSGTQAKRTAELHFSGQTDLMLVALDEASLAQSLKWEASRGGDLFPHIYGTFDPAQVMWAVALPLSNGEHIFPSEFTP
jgi:uncharacterized protein (DUF952 family)